MLALKLHHARLQEITSRLSEVAGRSADAAMLAEAGWLIAEAQETLERVRLERGRMLVSTGMGKAQRRTSPPIRMVAQV